MALVKRKLVDEASVVDLRFDELWDAVRHKKWGEALDLYKLLLIPLVKQVQCEGTLRDVPIAGIARANVYKDVLLNSRLPLLVSLLFECLGIPHKGEDSLSSIISSSNDFVRAFTIEGVPSVAAAV